MIKPIPEHTGYFVDTKGNVYSQWINKGRHGLVKGTELKKVVGSKTKKGHRYIRFGRRSTPIYVHRLVYEIFNGPIPKGLLVRHLNDIPSDNRIENLTIGTHVENMADAKRNDKFPIGSKNGHSKLTEKDVMEIRSLSKDVTNTELSKRYNVSRATIREARNKRTWKHVN